MQGNTFNISGLVYRGANLMTNGYIKVRNTNKPEQVTIVPAGSFEDGSLEVGRYDAWFRTQEEQDIVVETGDVFELTVFNTFGDAVNDINKLSDAIQTDGIADGDIGVGYLQFNVQITANMLPSLPQILSDDNVRYTNNRTLYWTWIAPNDVDGDSLHFQIEWSPTSEFLPANTVAYDTTKALDRSLVSWQDNYGNWVAFPAGGLPNVAYGNRCKLRITMDTSGYFYWRVRATDQINR